MSLLFNIREQLANLEEGKFTAVRGLKGGGKAWIHWEKGGKICVFIPTREHKEPFEEDFSSVRIRVAPAYFTGKRQYGILLECKYHIGTRSIFASLCEDFVRPENRQLVTTETAKWCDAWRDSLGNSLRKRNPCEVIAELLVLSNLHEARVSPHWAGPKKATHDIVCLDFEVEVKSSTVRTSRIITLSSENQLKAHGNRPLFLVFCRFEKHSKGQYSIEACKNALVKAGYDSDIIENGLSDYGYQLGKRDRYRRYNLLEDAINYYVVDESFPRITPESFVGGTVPQGILPNIEYRVDLSDKKLKRMNLCEVLQRVARLKKKTKTLVFTSNRSKERTKA